jgi:solute carrier family 25 phosphate transporter 23/24/25/41
MMAGGHTKLSNVISATWAQNGVKGFFRGNLVNVVRTIPTKSIQFAAFDGIKVALTRKNPKTGLDELPPWASGVAGSLSGVGACRRGRARLACFS